MRRSSLALPLLLLGACGPLVQIGGNAPAPTALLTLRATTQAQAGAGQTVGASAVTVEVPTVPATLQTLRLPVTIADTQVQYLTQASWAEQPQRLFQRVLADTIAARGTPVLDPRAGPAARRVLSGTLREFGLDVRDPAVPTVRVRFDAVLSGGAGGTQVRRFEASAPAAAQSGDAVAQALNTAANQVAADVAGWVGS